MWLAAAAGLAWLARAVRAGGRLPARLRGAWLPVGFVVAVLVGGLVAYPVFDDRRSTGAGSDADDGVLLVIDELRSGEDLYRADTYLGNPPTSGPGAVLWFLPWSTQATYPIGIALAVAVTVATLRWGHGTWDQAGIVALLLGASVPFWEGLGQGSDHLPFACSLVWAAVVLRPRPVPIRPEVAVAAGAVIGLMATSRVVFGFVPLVAAAAVWWRDRRAAVLFGATGTAVAVALHLAFIARSGWSDYDAVQQLFVKSDEDLGTVGKALVVAGALMAVALVADGLRRRGATSVESLLLRSVAPPMTAIALAGLLHGDGVSRWSAGNYFLDSMVLAAYWFAIWLTDRPGVLLEGSAARGESPLAGTG